MNTDKHRLLVAAWSANRTDSSRGELCLPRRSFSEGGSRRC